MASKTRTLVAWSGGKDSAWMLSELLADPAVEVVGLFSTVSTLDGQDQPEVAMHGIPAPLLRAQAEAVGLPLDLVELPWPCPNEQYEEALLAHFERQAEEHGVRAAAFGDLYLADVRAYREDLLTRSPLGGLYPLWHRPTPSLSREMIDGGLRATVTAVDLDHLDISFLGRAYDRSLLADLPAGVDPCGERGEMHTFVTDAPCFARPLGVTVGELEVSGPVVVARPALA